MIFHSYVSLPEGSLHQLGICHPSTNAEAPVRLHPRPGAPQPPGAAWRPEIVAGVIPHGDAAVGCKMWPLMMWPWELDGVIKSQFILFIDVLNVVFWGLYIYRVIKL